MPDGTSYRLQVLMNKIDHHSPLPHRRGHPPDHVMKNVACGKDAGYAGFQQEGVPLQCPALGPATIAEQVLAGLDEPGLIPFHHSLYQIGMRDGPYEDEHGSSRNRLGIAGIIVLDRKRIPVPLCLSPQPLQSAPTSLCSPSPVVGPQDTVTSPPLWSYRVPTW